MKRLLTGHSARPRATSGAGGGRIGAPVSSPAGPPTAVRIVLCLALLAMLLGLSAGDRIMAEEAKEGSAVDGQIAAAARELKADQDDLYQLKEIVIRKDDPAKAQALAEIEWARKNQEFALRRLELAKAAPNDAAKQVELKDALLKAEQARNWERRAQSSFAPPPAVAAAPAPVTSPLPAAPQGPPRPRGGLVYAPSEAWRQAEGISRNERGFDVPNRPDVQMADPINYDPEGKILTTSSGSAIPVRPLTDAVQRVLPGVEPFVEARMPDGAKVVRVNPEVIRQLSSPEKQQELRKIGGVALDVTFDLLAYAGVAEFRRRGPATIIDSPVLLSLRSLGEKLRPYAEPPGKWQDLPEELRYPGGIERIHGLILDYDRADVFLVGAPAADAANRIDVDTLVVGLRTVWRKGEIPTVSLDPLPDRPAGPQYSRVTGVPLHTTFARIMLDADYAMKRILFGQLDVGEPGFAKINEECALEDSSQSRLNRYWLTPRPLGDRDVHVSPTYRTMLFDTGVRCLTESQNGVAEWTGAPNPWAERKARLFTESYGKIERSESASPAGIFVRLHGLVDIVTVSKALRELGVRYPVLDTLCDLPLRALREEEDVPPYYPGLCVTVAVKRISETQAVEFTLSGGAVLKRRLAGRSLDRFQDLTTATLEGAADAFDGTEGFCETLPTPLAVQKTVGDARDDEYAMLKGRALLRAGDFEGARAQFVKLTSDDPLFADAWAWLGEALSLAGDHEEAYRAAGRALEIEPEDFQLLGMRYTILFRAGEAGGGVEAGSELARALSREHALEAADLLEKGKKEDAAGEAGRALDLWPENPDAWLIRSLTTDELSDAAMRDRAEAIRLYRAQLKEPGEDAGTAGRRLSFALLQDALARSAKLSGTIGYELGGYSSFTDAWRLEPDKMHGLFLDLFSCVSEAKEARGLDDQDGLASAAYARSLAAMMILVSASGRPVDEGLAEAAAVSRETVKNYPGLPDAHFARAYVAFVEIGVTWREMKTPGLFSERERAALTRALDGLAAELFERLDAAIRLDPTYGEALLFRALNNANIGRGEMALADLRKARALLPFLDPRVEAMVRDKAAQKKPR